MKTIRIKKFGVLKDTGTVNISRVTVLTGDNGAGKSLFMKTLNMCERIKYEWKDLINFPTKVYGVENYFNRNELADTLDNALNFFFLKNLLTKDTFIEYEDDKCTIIIQNETIQITKREYTTRPSNKLKKANLLYVPPTRITFEYDYLNFVRYKAETPAYYATNHLYQYIGIMNNIIQGIEYQSYLDMSTGNLSKRIIEEVSTYLSKQKHPFHLYIDDPEQNLFPNKQRKLIKDLISKVKKNTDNTLVLTTHSPYILSTLNTLLNTDKNIDEETKIDYTAYFLKNGTVEDIKDNLNTFIRFKDICKQ